MDSVQLWFQLKKEYHTFLDYVYPRFCLGCEAPLMFGPYLYLCSSCIQKLPAVLPSRCLLCAQPLPYIKKCAKCQGKHFPWKQLFCAYEYQELLSELILCWKNGKNVEPTEAVLKKLFQQGLENFSFPEIDLIIPVPSDSKKQILRGFNPAKVLGVYVSRFLKVPLNKKVLTRIFETPSQKQLSEGERQINLQGAFACQKVPKKILVVDDIFTTGSTLREVCKVLKQAGASRVYGLVLARTPRHFGGE